MEVLTADEERRRKARQLKRDGQDAGHLLSEIVMRPQTFVIGREHVWHAHRTLCSSAYRSMLF